PLTEQDGVQQYTPLTLRARMLETSPVSASLVADWGMALANGLSVLHRAGLVHRDVKPTNILFVDGSPRLGDYGLVSQPGGRPESRGTEGFQPMEGSCDQAADLFALGKPLYEAWSKNDRLESPSLPREVLDAPEWLERGSVLNEIIL